MAGNSFWGPEFLDAEMRVAAWGGPYPQPKGAWHRGPHPAVEVPLTTLWKLAQPARVQQVRKDHERLAMISAELVERGVDSPLVLVADGMGRLMLGDGHHRLMCADALGWVVLPCRVTTSERARAHAVPLADVFVEVFAFTATRPTIAGKPS